MSATAKQEFKAGWPVVMAAMFGIGLGLSPVPFYTIGMLAPELNKAFGWEFSAIMGGLPIMTLGVLVASPLVGWLADRHGVRQVALISIVLFALSLASGAPRRRRWPARQRRSTRPRSRC